MYLLRTSKSKEYTVSVVAPVFDGSVTIMMGDKRSLSVIAPEFDGIERMEYYVDSVLQATYEGYSVLSAILRTDINNMVQIQLKRP